jgi:hypothetical protein
VLTPLARAIADARVPTGDQFLFLTATGTEIEVRFVGLDADRPSEPVEPVELPHGELRAIVRSGGRSEEEQRRLRQLTDSVSARVDGLPAVRKALLLTEMTSDGFWERDDRFAVLAEAEYLDRLEEATRTARHLADRLLRASDRPSARR